MILILWVSVGLRVTEIGRVVTVSMVMFQKPVLGTVILAGKRSKWPPWYVRRPPSKPPPTPSWLEE